MYQFIVKDSSPLSESINFYENLDSLGVTSEDNYGNTNLILLEFIGQTTNWKRTVITLAPPYSVRTKRSWKIVFSIYKFNFLSVVDTEAQRRNGVVYLPQPEIYNINFYHQVSTTNLDINNANKIDITAQITTQRTVDNPAIGNNNSPVSFYSQYSENDVVDGKDNINIEYGNN